MNKKFFNALQARIERLDLLSTYVVGRSIGGDGTFTTAEAAVILHLSQVSAYNFIQSFDCFKNVGGTRKSARYTIPQEILKDFDSEAIALRSLKKSGITDRNKSRSPQDMEINRLKTQVSRLEMKCHLLQAELASQTKELETLSVVKEILKDLILKSKYLNI